MEDTTTPKALCGRDSHLTEVSSQSEQPVACAAPAPPMPDEPPPLEPQLKYERLGGDVKSILTGASATCLCLSEKVLALGTSAGAVHILDYSGNEVRRRPVTFGEVSRTL